MLSDFKLKPIHPIATILNNLRLIALITAGGTFLLGVLILVRVKPTYLSEAAFEVTLLHSRLLVWDQEKQFSSRTQYTDYVNTQVNYLVSFENVTETLKTVDLAKTPLIPGDNDYETYLRFIRMVRVQPVHNTHLISVALENSEPEGLSLLVNALVDTYFKRTLAYETGKSVVSIEHLRKELARERDDLAKMQEQMTRYSLDLGTLNLTREMNPHDDSLGYLRQALNEAIVERVMAENALNALEQSVSEIQGLGVDPLVEEFVSQDLNTIEMKNRTFEVTEELNRQSSSLTTDHPKRQRLQEDADRAQQYLEDQLAESRAKASRILAGKLNLEQKRALIEQRAQYEASVKNELDVRARYEQEMGALKRAIPMFLSARNLNQEIEHTQAHIAQIESRLEELSVEVLEPGRLRIQSRARDPIVPLKDRRKLFLIMAALFCGTIGVAAAFARDLLEPSVIDPQHMTTILGTRPTGVLPHWSGRDFGQLMRRGPDSYHSDHFRRIMPRIFGQPGAGKEPRIFTVVSLVHGHGATSVALNCLTYLEQTGRRAGLLDPCEGNQLPARIASWEWRQLGAEESSPRSEAFPLVIHASPEGGECYHLERPYARDVYSAAEQLKAQLDELAARTGCLLLDAPPLFQDAESEIYCRLADTVLLVVNGPKISAGALSRGMAQLEEIGVKKCAVIANDLPILPGGYFSRDMAAFQGKNLRYLLVRDAVTAVKKALDPRNFKI